MKDKTCECGCNRIVKDNCRFIHGHNRPWLGKHHSEETKKKIALNRYNPMIDMNNRKKISEALKGKMPKNINLINKDKFGVNNPMWNGGSSLRGYDKNWNRKFRHTIRNRDNFICLICGKHQEKEGKSLCVHHINYNKLLSIKENCITICSNCHHKTNINRDSWIPFLQSILNKRYNYTYSDNMPEICFKIAKELENDILPCPKGQGI